MTEKEQKVRDASRALFEAKERRDALLAAPAPEDRDERMALFEALQVQEAECSRLFWVLERAKGKYAA